MKELYHNFLHAFSGTYTRKILIESIDLLGKLWPYLVAGILLSTIIKLYLSREKISDFFQSRNHTSIILAALIGIVSPIGSYVMIPLSAALYTTGVPLPVLMSLLVSSPLINPNLFILTAGAFSLELALLRTFAAFMLGITAGYLTIWELKHKWVDEKNIINKNSKTFDYQSVNGHIRPKFKDFAVEFYKMSKYIGKYFFIAIILAAAIKILISPNAVVRLFSGNIFISVLLTTAAGVPFYVCGGAAIPVVQQLAQLGMSKGAVLAYFISGPATKISNLVLMKAEFNSRIFLIYISTGILGAIALGLMYNFF